MHVDVPSATMMPRVPPVPARRRSFGGMVCIILLILGALAAHPARATALDRVMDRAGAHLACETAIAAAETQEALPAGLLGAIAVVETGRSDAPPLPPRPWPWTVNAEGLDIIFDSKEAAMAGVATLQSRGVRSVDVGCLQVNLLSHPQAFTDLAEALDPLANAVYAARFLRSLFAETGDWPSAVAHYHSRTPARAAPYRDRVLARWRPGRALFDRWVRSLQAAEPAPATEAPAPAQRGALRSGPIPAPPAEPHATIPNLWSRWRAGHLEANEALRTGQTAQLLALTASCTTSPDQADQADQADLRRRCQGLGRRSPFHSVLTLRGALALRGVLAVHETAAEP